MGEMKGVKGGGRGGRKWGRGGGERGGGGIHGCGVPVPQ